METRAVYWKGKFGGDRVTINSASFNPAIHSDEPWEAEKKAGEKTKPEKKGESGQ